MPRLILSGLDQNLAFSRMQAPAKTVAWIPLGHLTTASSRLRVYQVADLLHRHYGVVSLFPGAPMSRPPDVLVAQIYSPEVVTLAAQLKRVGCHTLLDVCDNVWDTCSPNFRQQWNIEQALRIFDGVLATTPTLAERLRARFPWVRCHVVPDSIDMREIVLPPKRHSPLDGTLRIVWFGTEINLIHVRAILPALQRLHREQPLRLHVISKAQLYELPGIPVEFVKWGLDTFHRDLQVCDVVILPMPLNESTDVKSPNRLQLCMALGLPAVVSPLPSYVELLGRHPEVAFIADGVEEWYRQLHRLLDPGLRNTVAVRAREIIEAEYTLEQHAEQWRDALFSN